MTAAELLPPPVPADADLTDFKFMPLEVARLRRSKAWLICKRRPELAFYMLNLWTASWHERPAGSLEDDDDVLADAAMCSPEKWPKVRKEALRGWTKAADGRLYHPVVAEKVNDSWHGKAVARWTKECDRIRKENHKRKENQQPPLDFPPKPERNAAAIPAESCGIPPEKPLKGEGERREREGKEEDSHSQAGRAQPLPDGWWPSDALLDRARQTRPDIQPARLKLETQGFISRKRTDNAHSHNWDETFIGWIIKTKIEERGINGAQRTGTTQRGGGSQARNRAAFGAALDRLRREGSAGGGDRDRRQEGDDARDVEATVLDVGQGSTGNGEEGA